MKNIEFFYWLQGYFEIGMVDELNHDQIEIIQNHIKLVKKCVEEHDRTVHNFIYKVEGYLSAIKELKTETEIPYVVLALRNDLSSLFKYEVDQLEDKGDPDLKEKLADIHKPKPSYPNNFPTVEF